MQGKIMQSKNMQCPSCNRSLDKKNECGIELDVCMTGCGGVWFDASELENFDDEQELVSSSVLFSGKNQNSVVIDRAKIRKCPKCTLVDLDRNCHYSDFDIEIDSCPQCAGIWLDPGELNLLREQNQGREKRAKVINDFLQQAESAKDSSRINAVIRLLFK